MSSGFISSDKKTIGFDLTLNGVAANFILTHIDGDSLNPDKIKMEMITRYVNGTNASSNSTSVIITKNYTKVLSHWFRHAAEIMDAWYKQYPDTYDEQNDNISSE